MDRVETCLVRAAQCQRASKRHCCTHDPALPASHTIAWQLQCTAWRWLAIAARLQSRSVLKLPRV